MSFNGKNFNQQNNFTCNNCGYPATYKIANLGCPICSNNLFVVADKGIPRVEEGPEDEFILYHHKNKTDGSGRGENKTQLGQEDFFGGGNERGKLDPRNNDEDPVKELPVDTVILDDLDDGTNGQIGNDKLPATNYDLNLFGDGSPLGNPFLQERKTPYGNMQATKEMGKDDSSDIFLRPRNITRIKGALR